MHDILYNTLLSGGMVGAYLTAEHLLDSRSAWRTMKPKKEKRSNPLAVQVAQRINDAAEEFLEAREKQTLADRGQYLDFPAVIDAQIQKRTGGVNRNIFLEKSVEPTQQSFIIAYTSACQYDFSPTQSYVVGAAQGMAQAITNLKRDVAIVAIGRDMTIVKQFDDGLPDLSKVKVGTRLNLFQGLENLMLYENSLDRQGCNIILLMNGHSHIADNKYICRKSFSANALLLALRLYQSPSALPRIEGLHANTFAENCRFSDFPSLVFGLQGYLERARAYAG